MEREVKNFLCILLKEDDVGREYLQKVLKAKYKSFSKSTEYLDALEKVGIKVIAFDEKEYPKILKEIPDFPILLFAKGNTELLRMRMVTMVGTRDMTKYGKDVVRDIIPGLKDICFVSGLARGIDGEVHKTCLKSDISTIAVIAGGLFGGFPKSNRWLFEKICEQELVISEFPPGRKIIKGMFPMRNRILAGISGVSVIVESGIKGGSMITANMALEYGRDVFSVPGDILSTTSQGCNSLISQGAEIVLNKEYFKSLLNDCVQ